jgi:cAMP-dependent protein kinase regulator
MINTKEQRIEEHRRFMEANATIYLKPLMVDILKAKPDDVLEFMVGWCHSRGQVIRKEHGLGVKAQPQITKNAPEEAPEKKEKTVTEVQETPSSAPTKPPSMIDAPTSPVNKSVKAPSNEVIASADSAPAQEAPVAAPTDTAADAPSESPVEAPIQAQQADQAYKPELPSSEDDENDLEEDDERLAKLNSKKNQNKKKMGISAEAYGNYNQMGDFTAPVIEKSDEQREQIRKTLGLSFMFKNLDEKDFQSVMGAMAVKTFADGDFVIKQGDDGAELFIVGDGTLRCEKLFPDKDAPTVLKTYNPGEVFGELSLMYNAPRAASIISEGPSVCFSLDRDTFNNIVKGAAIKRRNVFEEFLAKIDILADLEPYERSKICDCLATETFSMGEFVIREGEDGNKFYLVQEGTAEAIKEIDGENVTVMSYEPNSYFGELALINNEKRKASIRVTSEKMVVATLDRASFKRMLGPIEGILQRNTEKYAKYAQQLND